MDMSYGYVFCFACDNYVFDEEFCQTSRTQTNIALTKNSKLHYEWQPNNKEENYFSFFVDKKFNYNEGYNGKNLWFLSTLMLLIIISPAIRSPRTDQPR